MMMSRDVVVIKKSVIILTILSAVVVTPDAHPFSGNAGAVIHKTFTLNNTGNTTVSQLPPFSNGGLCGNMQRKS